MEKILVPVDGSTTSQKAAVKAVDIARKYGGRITFITVVKKPEIIGVGSSGYGTIYSTKEITEDLVRHQTVMLDEFEAELGCADITAEKKVVLGEPFEEILKEAEDGRFELIVMGRRGFSKIKRFFMGSVSSRVISDAPCPVLVINEEKEKEEKV